MKKEYDFSKGKRGPVLPRDPNKVRITIRLDADVVEHFKEKVRTTGGGNYQTLINEVLRDHINIKSMANMSADSLKAIIEEAVQKGMQKAS
ncbi:MAG: BrnA antitoxin family protein [Proteobacteria bacterium]|nr:BrnA antitoxin family protein [Pseudomonadota bacterium]